MQLSPNGLSFITSNEELRLKPYLDSAEVPTIGVGTTVYPGGEHVTMHDPAITREEAQFFLLHDTGNVVSAVNVMLHGIIVNQNQFDSLVDFSYNEGTPALHGSTLLKLIKANVNDLSIRTAFMMWDKIHKDGKLVYSPGLSNRRKRDSDLYFLPI